MMTVILVYNLKVRLLTCKHVHADCAVLGDIGVGGGAGHMVHRGVCERSV